MMITVCCMEGAYTMLIKEKIRLLREKLLLTQDELADALGVSASTINRWETGKVRPNMAAMRKIKSFCESKGYPYEEIESAWLMHS